MEPQPRRHGPWTILRTHEVYHDPWITLRVDDVRRPDDRPGTYAVVWLKTGVSVLAIDEHDHVWLTDEFHYGVGRRTIEVVSGGIEADEPPLLAAQRELQEELGLTAARWTPLGVTDPFTSAIVSPTQLFLAEGLTQGAASPEITEDIRPVVIPFATAMAMLDDGRITHGPTCLLLLRVWRLRQSRVE